MRFAERSTTAMYPLGLLKEEIGPSMLVTGATVLVRGHSETCSHQDCSRTATVIAGPMFDNSNRDNVYVTVVYPFERFPLKQEQLRIATRSAWGMWHSAVYLTAIPTPLAAEPNTGNERAYDVPEAS